jgi:hypothetical protein
MFCRKSGLIAVDDGDCSGKEVVELPTGGGEEMWVKVLFAPILRQQ